MNDLSVSNNGDMEKVLATVVDALYVFSNRHPDALVYLSGSTKARTRLYRMAITKYFETLQRDFYVYGRNSESITPFEPDKAYTGFLAQRKLM